MANPLIIKKKVNKHNITFHKPNFIDGLNPTAQEPRYSPWKRKYCGKWRETQDAGREREHKGFYYYPLIFFLSSCMGKRGRKFRGQNAFSTGAVFLNDNRLI